MCYAIPSPKTIVGADMRCGRCKKNFMTHSTKYVDTLPSAEQIKGEFVTSKSNGSHTSSHSTWNFFQRWCSAFISCPLHCIRCMASTLTEKTDCHMAEMLVPVSAEVVSREPALPLQKAQLVYSDRGVSTPADSCHREPCSLCQHHAGHPPIY